MDPAPPPSRRSPRFARATSRAGISGPRRIPACGSTSRTAGPRRSCKRPKYSYARGIPFEPGCTERFSFRALASRRNAAIKCGSPTCGRRWREQAQTRTQAPAGPQRPAEPPGPAGPQGPEGPTGPAGSAKAYAVVIPGATPSFVASRTKNFDSVTHLGLGTYCLKPSTGIDPNGSAVVVGLEAQLSQLAIGSNVLEVYDYQGNTDCPGAIEVVTVANPQSGGGGSDKVAFTLLLT